MKACPIFCFSVALLFFSCKEKNVHFLAYKEIPNSSWEQKDSIDFEFEINDSLIAYDLFLELRTTTSYNWSNVFIFSDLKFPNQKTRRDTFEFELADKYGKWHGNKTGTTVENSLKLYNKKVNFPLIGNYHFTIHQAMRELSLKGIMDVGVKIKKVQE
tara:strand:+ start:255 stop:728 length:474 start_codon:yes stop_codon:yes gene_type:complete